MLFGKKLLASVPFLAGFVAASAGVEERDVCININGPVIQVYITTQTINVPVLINTYVPTTGVITVAGGTTINIINAPTQVITVVNSVATQTNSQTATITVGPNGVSTQVGPSINIINYPVYISTYIQQNTIINNNGATVIVNNAPTTLVTTATGTITQTVTTTSTVTTNVVQPTVIVQVAGPAINTPKVRRQVQAAGFLASDGSLVSSCSNAVPLVLQNGQLLVANTANYYSANNGDSVITFAASAVVRAISTVFSFNNNTATGLQWANSAFTNGQAQFFVQNNFLRAQLTGVAPVGQAALATIAASRCVSGTIVPASTSTSTSTSATSTSTSSSSTTLTSTSSTSTSTGSTSSTSTSSGSISTAVTTSVTTQATTLTASPVATTSVTLTSVTTGVTTIITSTTVVVQTTLSVTTATLATTPVAITTTTPVAVLTTTTTIAAPPTTM